MTLPRLLAPILALACTLPAFAGMEKESQSTRGGLFFAMLTPDMERVMARFNDRAQRHHVFVRKQDSYVYMGEVPGAPDSYVDIDGNDLPGLVVVEGCDGWCISLWGLTGGLRQVGTFGGH